MASGGGGVCVNRRNFCWPAGVRMNCCATGEEIGMKVWDAGKKMVPGGAAPVAQHRRKFQLCQGGEMFIACGRQITIRARSS